VKTEVGANWIARFLDQHPQLEAKFTTPMENAEQHHLQQFEITLQNRGGLIKEPEVYNIDERGVLMGLAQSSKVVCSHQGGSKFKLPDDGHRELLSVIGCVSGHRVLIHHLGIIYNSANHYTGWHQFTSGGVESKEFWISQAKKGWTD